MEDIKNEIIHYMTLLQFLKPLHITDETINKIKLFIESLEPAINVIVSEMEEEDDNASCIYNVDAVQEPPKIMPPPPRNNIIDIPNKILKLAFIRNVGIDIINIDKFIIYKKIKYEFDNIYENSKPDDQSSLLLELSDFLMKRLQHDKKSSLILYGYTASGKSTIVRNLLTLVNCARYRLYEIYLNKINVYHKGKKQNLTDDINDSKYIFDAPPSAFLSILNKFTTVSATEANNNSSRAHTILTLYFPSSCGSFEVPINIIDLCGNERPPTKRGFFAPKQDQEKEMIYINKSLFSVAQYLKAPTKYKNNSCMLYNAIKDTQNIIFMLMFNDNPALNLYSHNHLMVFKDLYKSSKYRT